MFRRYLNMLALMTVLAPLGIGAAQAGPIGWFFPGTYDQRAYQPYLYDGKTPQNAQHRRGPWTLEEWTADQSRAQTQIDQMFRAGVFVEYDADGGWWDDTPTLVVGPSFYHLSTFDQGRALALCDHFYGLSQAKGGTVALKDWHTDRVVGLYGRHGLHLQ